MQDVLSLLSSLSRPGLLIRTARIGAQTYRRDRHLGRVLGYGIIPGPAKALLQLMELEREADEARKENAASYSLPRHLDLLIAIIGEAQVLKASRVARKNLVT